MTANDHEIPQFLRHVAQTMACSGSISGIHGVQERWVAPVALHDAPTGFGEETWCEAHDSVLAWILGGADVHCEFGKYRGASTKPHKYHVTLHPKGAPNHFRATGQISIGQFVVTPALLKIVADGLGLPCTDHSILRDDLIFAEDTVMHRALMDYASRATDWTRPPTRVEMEARALLIVERLLSEHHLQRPRPKLGGLTPRALKRVTDYMLAHLAEDIALAELANVVDLSPFHFAREFKRTTGLPPHAWLTERRIARAKEIMMTQENLGLTEIALSVGYESQAAFGTAFKRHQGTAPGVWRRHRLR